MTDFWRIPDDHETGKAPDWVLPFLAVDAEWSNGRAEGQSSGSTGTPKTFAFTPEAIVASAHATADHFGLTASDAGHPIAAWSALPSAGIGGRMMWWRTRILNWSLTQSRPAVAPRVPPAPGGRPYDFAVATPQQASELAKSNQLSAFRTLLLGGAAVSPMQESEILKAAETAGCSIQLGFGMTETLTHIATRRLGNATFLPLPGVTWDIAENGGLILHAPDRGVRELHTRDVVSPSIDPETGRSGFCWLGRLDDVINTGGLKVHPADLESRIAEWVFPLIGSRRWYIAGRPHPTVGMQVTLVLEGQPNGDLEQALMDQLSQVYSHPDRPRAVLWMDPFEETETGKIRRR